MPHVVTVNTVQRPDYAGRLARRYLVRCRCGWSEGWLTTKDAADAAAAAHRGRFVQLTLIPAS